MILVTLRFAVVDLSIRVPPSLEARADIHLSPLHKVFAIQLAGGTTKMANFFSCCRSTSPSQDAKKQSWLPGGFGKRAFSRSKRIANDDRAAILYRGSRSASILSSISLPISLNLTGFVKNKSTPLAKALAWSRLLARPVNATISAGRGAASPR